MKVGDLVHWYSRKDELGIILEIYKEEIKVADLNAELEMSIDWWSKKDWKILQENP